MYRFVLCNILHFFKCIEVYRTFLRMCMNYVHLSVLHSRTPNRAALVSNFREEAVCRIPPTCCRAAIASYNKSTRFFFFKHDLLYASWTENSTGFSSCSFSMKKKEQLVCSRAFGVIKVNIILATVIELHSCYHSSTWAPPTKEKTSDGEGRGHGESRERASELRPRNAKGKIKLRRRKTKSRAGERQRERENQYLALKRGLHQRCNYAKCVLFTRQQATEISQPGGLEPN